VNDESHVKLADAHAETDGCDDDLSAACEPVACVDSDGGGDGCVKNEMNTKKANVLERA
jgi:hypothetical protein